MVHTCNPGILGEMRQEDCKFEPMLGNLAMYRTLSQMEGECLLGMWTQ